MLKSRKNLFGISAGSWSIFGICVLYMSVINPIGPCLNSGLQIVALLLGMATFCLGAATSLAWAIWTAILLLVRRNEAPQQLGLS